MKDNITWPSDGIGAGVHSLRIIRLMPPSSLFLMSSTPHSPPETPLKRAMAIDNEKLTRTRLPDEAPKGDSKGSMAPLEVTRLDGFANKVQVPATQPLEAPVPQDIQSDRNKMLQNHGDAEHVSTEDLKAELLPFDWEDLEKRYKKAVTEANDAENLLVEEFLQISEVNELLALSHVHSKY
jgi:hypothetical protein